MVDKTGRRVYTEYNINRDGIHTKLDKATEPRRKKMKKYYYMIGHDSNEISFEEFNNIQELADAHYSGDIEAATNDTEYVFNQEEYDEWAKTSCVLQMQYEEGGEWFEIWGAETDDLEAAWDEMDEQPTEGGHIRFEGSEEFMVVNGGF